MLPRRRACVDRVLLAGVGLCVIVLLTLLPSLTQHTTRLPETRHPGYHSLVFRSRKASAPATDAGQSEEELDENEVRLLRREIEGERRAEAVGKVRYGSDEFEVAGIRVPDNILGNKMAQKQEWNEVNHGNNGGHESERGDIVPLKIEGSSEDERPKEQVTVTTTVPTYDLTLWSMDYDVANVFDMKTLLKARGVKVIDKSLSSRCTRTKTCASDLRVVNASNGVSLPSHLISEFYVEYKNDPEMSEVDAFLCVQPVSMCELYEPFNKPMILLAQDRYELGRQNAERWQNWNEKLKTFSRDPRHVIAATNQYDATYIQYFTGLMPLQLPQHCGYVRKYYAPKYASFLLGPVRNLAFKQYFMKTFHGINADGEYNVSLVPVEDAYKPYRLPDVASHRAIVFIPSRVSQIRLTEIYRTNTPMFVPSVRLLVKWQQQYRLVKRRLSSRGKPAKSNGSAIDGVINLPDPNNEVDSASLLFWLKLSDVYSWPHITYFSSLESLARMLANASPKWMHSVSAKMARHNQRTMKSVEHTWDKILQNIETN